jgi:exopolysaccharide production protein ExoZ
MIYNVQYLRFVAASMVVLHHTLLASFRYWPDDAHDRHQFVAGAAGVDIFFVISGFIMVFISEKKERSPLDFVRHRLARVVPPYWVVTICIAVAMLIAPSAFQVSRFELPHFLASLLFLPYPHPTLNEALPLYAPGWTLNYEFFFYMLFAAAMAINSTNRVALASSALIALVIAGYAWPNENVAYAFYTNPIMLEFVYGMIIGRMVIRGASVPRSASFGLILLGIAGLIAAAQYSLVERLSGERILIYGLPAALLVAGSITLEFSKIAKPINFIVMLGNASYAIYVTHYILLGSILKGCSLFGLSPGFALTAICFVGATAIGVLFHFAIERPLVALHSGRPRSSKRAAIA